MVIEDLNIQRITNGVLVKWTEKHKTSEKDRDRYEYREYYTTDLHHAFDKIAELWEHTKQSV